MGGFRIRGGGRINGIARQGLAVAAPLLVAAGLAAPAAKAASSGDRAATHVYLKAEYESEREALADAPASEAEYAAAAAALGRECPGALAHAPADGLFEESGHETPKQLGERERANDERSEIDVAIDTELDRRGETPFVPAIERRLNTIATLMWSDPRVNALVQFELKVGGEGLGGPPLAVCADIVAWANSGYTRLPAELGAHRTAPARPEGSLPRLLEAYEGPAERELVRKTRALERAYVRANGLVLEIRAYKALERALGVSETKEERAQERRAREPVVARGRTLLGERFLVRRESSPDAGEHCHHAVEVEFKSDGGPLALESGEGAGVCVSGPTNGRPSSDCDENTGTATLEGAVPGSVDGVDIELAGGRRIRARLVRVPRRDGGPANVYLQALRPGRQAIVAIVELDATGEAVKTVMLSGAIRCRREATHPGSSVTLARGTLPGGEAFTINGSLERFGGHGSFDVAASIDRLEDQGTIVEISGGQKAFRLQQHKGCPPKPYALLFGLLAKPGATVLARTAQGLVGLTEVPVPAKYHAEGALFYGVFETLPEELVVRRSDGSTLYNQSLVKEAKEESEFCEGFEEPSA